MKSSVSISAAADRIVVVYHGRRKAKIILRVCLLNLNISLPT
jgi:hypothetical protein